MLVILASISSRALALIYVATFGVGSLSGMFLMTTLVCVPLAMSSKHERLRAVIQTLAGVISVAFGVFYAAQITAGSFL